MKLKRNDILILIAIAVIIYIIVKANEEKKVKKENIDSEANAKDGSTPSLGNSEYKNKARTIYESFEGQYLFFDDATAKSDLLMLNNLSDADLIEVSNAFSDLYTTTNYKKSMKGLIQGEYLYSYASDAMRDLVVKRLGDLNA